MIKPDMRADWIVGQADGFRPLPTLMKNRTSDKPTYVRLSRPSPQAKAESSKRGFS